jgi:ribonuclease VapC
LIADTSALIAILRREAEGPRFSSLLLEAPTAKISAGTAIELGIIAERERGTDELQELLADLDLEMVPVDVVQIGFAIDGFRRFGKGRHPAALNLGDLFAYALARALDEPLLFKGDDFIHTDVKRAG